MSKKGHSTKGFGSAKISMLIKLKTINLFLDLYRFVDLFCF